MQFEQAVNQVTYVLEGAGYDALLLMAPDGTPLVSGSLDEPVIRPPNTRGS